MNKSMVVFSNNEIPYSSKSEELLLNITSCLNCKIKVKQVRGEGVDPVGCYLY